MRSFAKRKSFARCDRLMCFGAKPSPCRTLDFLPRAPTAGMGRLRPKCARPARVSSEQAGSTCGRGTYGPDHDPLARLKFHVRTPHAHRTPVLVTPCSSSRRSDLHSGHEKNPRNRSYALTTGAKSGAVKDVFFARVKSEDQRKAWTTNAATVRANVGKTVSLYAAVVATVVPIGAIKRTTINLNVYASLWFKLDTLRGVVDPDVRDALAPLKRPFASAYELARLGPERRSSTPRHHVVSDSTTSIVLPSRHTVSTNRSSPVS